MSMSMMAAVVRMRVTVLMLMRMIAPMRVMLLIMDV